MRVLDVRATCIARVSRWVCAWSPPGHAALHDPQVTPDYHASLPAQVRRHLSCRVVEQLAPVVQKHQIDGLAMGRTKG
jgi:hypothetical protein